MPEVDLELVDGGELNFNQSFLMVDVKKKIQTKSFTLNMCTVSTLFVSTEY